MIISINFANKSRGLNCAYLKYLKLLLTVSWQLDYSWEKYVADKYSIKNLNKDAIWMVVTKAVIGRRLPASALRESVKKVLRSFKLLKDIW